MACWHDDCVNPACMLRRFATTFPIVATGLLSSVPAHAADAFALPDPSDISLFALGLAGLLIRRRIARKRSDD